VRRKIVIAVVLAALACATSADAEPTAPIPAPEPGSPDQNIFYGGIAPFSENAPVIVFVHGLKGRALNWWVDNDMYQTVAIAPRT
jgi:pimeloyl-ACP methyl ester carboxylesterase